MNCFEEIDSNTLFRGALRKRGLSCAIVGIGELNFRFFSNLTYSRASNVSLTVKETRYG